MQVFLAGNFLPCSDFRDWDSFHILASSFPRICYPQQSVSRQGKSVKKAYLLLKILVLEIIHLIFTHIPLVNTKHMAILRSKMCVCMSGGGGCLENHSAWAVSHFPRTILLYGRKVDFSRQLTISAIVFKCLFEWMYNASGTVLPFANVIPCKSQNVEKLRCSSCNHCWFCWFYSSSPARGSKKA